MIYVLIMVFMVDRGGTVVQQEFNSLDACMSAGLQIAKGRAQHFEGSLTIMRTVCVPKGEKK